MFRFLSDENFNGDIVRGLLLREPNLDLLRVQDVGLRNAEDPDIVSWAISNSRIILTHDRATMPDFFLCKHGTRNSDARNVRRKRPYFYKTNH